MLKKTLSTGRTRVLFFIMLLSAVLAFILPQTSATAVAAEAQPNSVVIEAEKVGPGDYKLAVTNESNETILSLTGQTSIPEDIRDAQESVSWQLTNLNARARAYAQTSDGADLILHVREDAAEEDVQQAVTATTVTSAESTGTQEKKTLSHTGVAVAALALSAFGFVFLGAAFVWRDGGHGRLAVRRGVAVMGALSLVVGLGMVVSPQKASAAVRTQSQEGISTSISVQGKTYELMSAVQIRFAQKNTMTSLEYAKAMGAGWNLGNSFDGVDTDLTKPDKGEEAWGNPKVTRELIHSIKAKGYTNIRMPFTVFHRTADTGDTSTINADWLKRYKQVVDWAVAEGLYVMVNVHHDSWIWLKNWNGDTSAPEYRKFTQYWTQIAQYFADEPLSVSFETINEPQFAEGDAQAKLNMLNKAAYDIIRSTPGNEERMIVIPTLGTAHDSEDKLKATLSFIQNELKNDPHILATVHYYADWVYSANLGKTRFDETLWDNNVTYTPRVGVDELAERMQTYFTRNGIGLVVGEWGLLAYDAASAALQEGEELKYYEYVSKTMRENGFAYILWDNGSGISRQTYAWKKPHAGAVLEKGITQRSATVKGLDTVYLKGEKVTDDVDVPLLLNGQTFVGIDGLNRDVDYTYNEQSATVTLKAQYLEKVRSAKNAWGRAADLIFQFSDGADWHEYVVVAGTPAVSEDASASATTVRGTKAEGLKIPVAFSGGEVRNVVAMEDGKRVGPHSGWWGYLQNGGAFSVTYDSVDRVNGVLNILPAFFSDSSVTDGDITLTVTFQDGQVLPVTVNVTGGEVTLKK